VSGEGRQWEFAVQGIGSGEAATLGWPEVKSEPGQQLWLHDVTNERRVDMLSASRYSFRGPGRFRVYYGPESYIGQRLLPEQSLLQVWPNPIGEQVRLGFTLADDRGQDQQVTLSLMDARGARLGVLKDGRYGAGFHQWEWRPIGLAPGLYLVELKVSNSQGNKTWHQKIIRK
jgi:hypothetical protein